MRTPIVERANIQSDFQIDLLVYRFGVGAAKQLIRYCTIYHLLPWLDRNVNYMEHLVATRF
jgi:hypothetical protein